MDEEKKEKTLTTLESVIALLIALATKWGWGDWATKVLGAAAVVVAYLLTCCTPAQLDACYAIIHAVK